MRQYNHASHTGFRFLRSIFWRSAVDRVKNQSIIQELDSMQGDTEKPYTNR